MGQAKAVKTNSGIEEEGKFTITSPQDVTWKATWNGSGTQGNDFWISNGFLGKTTDELVTNNVTTNKSGEKFLNVGEYSIAIKNGAMGPGVYIVGFV